MMKYIIKKMITDRKTTIGNIIFTSCLMAVFIICCHVIIRLKKMVKNKWYENSIEAASINDAFIREKLGAILWTLFILVGIISIFCLVVYALKLRLEIIKQGKYIWIFQILGYTKQRQIQVMWLGKMIETLVSFLSGSMIAYGIWKYLCKQEKFFEFITAMDENVDFQILIIWAVLFIFAVWNFFIIFCVIKRSYFDKISLS